MKTLLFLSWKYWNFHKQKIFSIVVAIIIGISSVTCMSFISRGLVVKDMENKFDNYGNYDSAILNVSNEQETILLNKANEKYLSYGFMCNIGNVIIDNSEMKFPIYYYDSETAQELYHLSLIEGRYPQYNKEIVISQTYANAIGIIAEVGTQLSINFVDLDDNAYSETFTIVGIISNNQNFRTLNIDYPEIFVYKEDFIDFKTSKIFLEQEDYTNNDFYLWTLIMYSDTKQITNNIDNTPENALIYKSMQYVSGYRKDVCMDILGNREYESTSDNKNILQERIKTNNIDGDFNSTVLIPIFSFIILILMVVSTYSSVKISIEERTKQFGMLRCIGLSAKQSTIMIIVEIGIISLISFIIGLILGILLYIIINIIQKNIFNIPIYWAFSVNNIVSAVTINPYIYSIFIGAISIIIATLIPAIKILNISPLEAYNVRKKVHFKRKTQKTAISLLNSRLKNSLNSLITISFVLSMSSSVFGILYFSSYSNNQTATYKHQIEENGLYDCDYVLKKDFNYANATDVTNRHDCGISMNDVDSMYRNSNIENINLMMIEPSTRISYENNSQNKIYDTALYRSSIDLLNSLEKFKKYNTEIKVSEGYNINENVYNVPTVGLTDNEILSLEKYLISGNINLNALKDGSQVIWVTLSNDVAEFLGIPNCKNPYQIDDVLPLSNIYLDEYDSYDFTKGLPDIMLNNPIVTFEEDNQEYTIYSVGTISTIKRYTSKIGAIIEINDINIAKQYFYDNSWGKCCFNIICNYQAYNNWGFNFNKFTNIGIELKNPNDKDFITLINSLSSNNDGIDLYSAHDLKKNIYKENINIMSYCIAILILISLISIINIWNSLNYSIKMHTEQFVILRSLGMSIKNLKKMMFFKNIKYPLIAIPFMILPIILFQLVRNRACNLIYSIQNSDLSIDESYSLTGWYKNFPIYIDLFEQPILIIFIITIILSLLITILINNRCLKFINQINIIDNIRKDTF